MYKGPSQKVVRHGVKSVEVPYKLKSTPMIVKSTSMIVKSTSMIDKTTPMIYLFFRKFLLSCNTSRGEPKKRPFPGVSSLFIVSALRLEVELVTNSKLEHAVALAAVTLVDFANTQVVTSVENEILVLVRGSKGDTELYGLARAGHCGGHIS